ncbi:hypothetical protein SASPL_138902 [Salvia splendens]|uniref:DUF7804 domain-containing protein n=1 Tax=Salvia splendens TaxID=180675 RepID=A0A8X8ZEQ6_SALSN|nr:hypothetical protein SASPL_138902 [Salvia splendens]
MASIGIPTAGKLTTGRPCLHPASKPNQNFTAIRTKKFKPPRQFPSASITPALHGSEESIDSRTRGGDPLAKIDSWLQDSVPDIVRNLKQAPLLVQIYSGLDGGGKGAECGPACYLLKTDRVCAGVGLGFCTHFCLMKVNNFRDSALDQFKDSWLLQ